ncbi:hypothetical protein M432DRAFT_587348 [Thermoascus aurantiacus ATCC 26904]
MGRNAIGRGGATPWGQTQPASPAWIRSRHRGKGSRASPRQKHPPALANHDARPAKRPHRRQACPGLSAGTRPSGPTLGQKTLNLHRPFLCEVLRNGLDTRERQMFSPRRSLGQLPKDRRGRDRRSLSDPEGAHTLSRGNRNRVVGTPKHTAGQSDVYHCPGKACQTEQNRSTCSYTCYRATQRRKSFPTPKHLGPRTSQTLPTGAVVFGPQVVPVPARG